MIGARGVIKEVDGRDAQLFLQGSWWGARSRSGDLHPGQEVRVVEMDGLRVIVEPEEDPRAATSEGGDR
jgi:membrane protein implicated in regulation of membrane protease activity